MSSFYDRVYALVERIPAGRVATYGQLAMLLGSPFAARAVGEAMRHAPEFLGLPCHRVVNARGTVAPDYAFGGKGNQRALLEAEGVPFQENGCIELKQCLWRP